MPSIALAIRANHVAAYTIRIIYFHGVAVSSDELCESKEAMEGAEDHILGDQEGTDLQSQAAYGSESQYDGEERPQQAHKEMPY